jgi:hypothetical protein
MRPEVLEAWKSAIQKSVAMQFPNFLPLIKRVRGEPRGILKFQWHPHPNLWCYIAFRPLDSEAFDVLVGWSTQDRFPIADQGARERIHDPEDFAAPSFIDWSLNLVPRSGAAHWNFWNPSDDAVEDASAFADAYSKHFLRSLTEEEANDLVRHAVELGIKEVRNHGIPYLRRRIAYEGVI